MVGHGDSRNIFVVQSTESVGHLRRHAVLRSDLDVEEALNYGLYLPPQGSKKGKFLEDERPIADYPVLLQSGGHRSRNADDMSSVSSTTTTTTLTNGLHHSPDSGVGQDPCWLELIYKSRMDAEDSPHQSRIRKLKTKVTQSHFMDMVRNQDVKGIEKLLAKGFDPNFWSRKDGEAPITAAVTTYHPRDLIITLVNGGAHIDFRARDSHTALHRAAICGNYEAIQTLLDLGQNPNCRDWRGLTPLYYAVSTDISARCTHALLYDHAILGVEDSKGFQEIHQACVANRPQHLENLIAYGADLNARTLRGLTPLHLCVRHEANACLSLLLLRGADTRQVNDDSQTPLEYALLTNRNEQATILQTFNPADVVAIKETPSYNTSRRPTVNGPRGAVVYTMLHRPSTSCSISDNLSLCHGVPSPAESLFSADQTSVTSFSAASTASATLLESSRSMQNIHRYANEDAASNPVKQLQQLVEAPQTKRSNTYNDPKRKTSVPIGTCIPSSEIREEKTYTRFVGLRKSHEGFGFTLNGVPRKALQRHGRQPLPNTPSNQYFSSVVPGGPADRAGIKEGDYVLEIDGQDVTDACHEDAVECIRKCGDSLILRVMTVYRGSTLRHLCERPEMPQTSRTYRRRRRSDIIGGSSSSTSSNSFNSDSGFAAHTSSSTSTTIYKKKLPVSRDGEQRWREPVGSEVRSRSRERGTYNPEVRVQSYSFGKEEIHLHATSPAAHSKERVFVFEKIDGKTRAVPVEDSREQKSDLRNGSGARFANKPCLIKFFKRFSSPLSETVCAFSLRQPKCISIRGTEETKSQFNAGSGHLSHAHSMMVVDCFDDSGEAPTTVCSTNRDTTYKNSLPRQVMQPFRSSLSVGCLQRINPSRGIGNDDEEEDDNDDGENNRSGGTTAIQRYAASKGPIKSEHSRSLPRLGRAIVVCPISYPLRATIFYPAITIIIPISPSTTRSLGCEQIEFVSAFPMQIYHHHDRPEEALYDSAYIPPSPLLMLFLKPIRVASFTLHVSIFYVLGLLEKNVGRQSC
ncbi:SH3 and multiple ankyrin repeat domains-containing protein [Echinococcus granulosus]|uniref:SH3 and multiple ankyrin repeat domains-containing protein n=1 Tax=Echinococcus granulosus TaxID=6210 RepID=W6V285_ECHGR|nr:SH3 and multiple ankyrin repeat domains-containing protein [Echinococcus granulosus]EUB59984.1 SH3 and multiple ankyrin repeat domains-containing protein [Echinococcus granulosus]